MTFDVIDEVLHYVLNDPPGERATRVSDEVCLASAKDGFDPCLDGSHGDPDSLPAASHG